MTPAMPISTARWQSVGELTPLSSTGPPHCSTTQRASSQVKLLVNIRAVIAFGSSLGAGGKLAIWNFSRIAGIKASHERIFAEWNAKKGGTAELTALVQERLGFKPTDSEAATLLDTMSGKPVPEWNHLLANPPGILGQIAGNHTGIGWTGTVHTADMTLITAVGPQAERFHGLVRNDSVHGKLLEMLLS